MARFWLVVGLLPVCVLGAVRASADPPARSKLVVAADVALPFEGNGVTLDVTAGRPTLVVDGVVTVPTAQGWTRRPGPRGLTAIDDDGTPTLFAAGGARFRLGDAGWIPAAAGRPLPAWSHAPAALDHGRVVAFGDNFTALWREQPDGQFARTALPGVTLLGTWASPGAVYALAQAGVSGSSIVARPLIGVIGHATGGRDRGGKLALAWGTAGALHVQRGGGEVVLRLPADDRQPDPAKCTTTPCPIASRWVDLAAGAGVLAHGGDLWVPLVETTMVEQALCRPNPEPLHPCDPGGPGSRCAPREPYVCAGPRTLRGGLGLIQVRGKRAERVALPALPGAADRALDLLAAALDRDGRLHLVLRWTEDAPSTAHGLRYLVLADRAERYPLPTTMAPVGPVALTSLDDVGLGLAGFRAEGPDGLEPRAKDGELRTGGTVGPGWWLAALDPPTERTISLELGLAAAAAACGRPGVAIQFGVGQVAAHLGAAGLEVDTPGAARTVIKLARPPTTLRVELDRRASKVLVDGAVVATGAGVGASTVAGTAVFGDQAGCGAAPQAATRWRALRLAP